MRKNAKGFTMVELLGVIVIIGILMVLGVPILLGVIDSNRNKIYVNDAQRLITKAEYKIKANNSEIAKPDPGNCIVISLLYLDDQIFDNPPYEGEYLKDSSFVVIKNNGGNLEYSAMLVEYYDDTYRGVELTRDTALAQKDAVKHVRLFKNNELINVANDYDPDDSDAMSTLLNNMLKKSSNVGNNYISGIDSVYNYPKEYENVIEDGTSVPKIDKVTVTSASNKGYNSLDALLSVSITDNDTPRNQLKVYVSTKSGEQGHAYSYSDNENTVFTQTFDLSKENDNDLNNSAYNYTDGGLVKFYVFVKDDKGNKSTTKVFDYDIYKNRPPVISAESQIVSRLSDNYNNSIANFRLVVDDDIDSNDDLLVCYTEYSDATSCDNYRPFNEIFDENNTLQYTFHECGNGDACPLDGRVVHLKTFVRDSFGLEAEPVILDYALYANQRPTLALLDEENPESGYVSISSVSDSDYSLSEGSLNVLVNCNPIDDLTESDNIKITLNELVGNSVVKTETFSGADNELEFSFKANYPGTSRDYDGSERILQIVLEDDQGLQSDSSNPIFTKTYRLYANKKPTVSDLQVVSKEEVCSNSDLCSSDDHNRNVIVSLNATDDIDSYSRLKVCVSDNPNYCTNDNNFKISYGDDFSTEFAFKEGQDKPYNGSVETLYAVVMDTGGAKSDPLLQRYTLYNNKPPVAVSEPEIVDDKDAITVTNTVIINEDPLETKEEEEEVDFTKAIGKFTYRISLDDDLTEENQLKLKVCYRLKGTSDVSCNPIKNYYVDSDPHDEEIEYYYEEQVDLGLTRYEGQIYEVFAMVMDSYYTEGSDIGIAQTPILEYKVYQDVAPVINSVFGAETEEYSPHTMKLNFSITDLHDTYKICISENDECTNYVGLTDTEDFDGKHYFDYSIDYTGDWTLGTVKDGEFDDDEEGVGQPFKIFAKDSYGNVSEPVDFVYKYYHTCKNVNTEVSRYDYEFDSEIENNEVISADRCGGNCYYWESISDELKNKMRLDSNGPSDTHEIFGYYKKKLTYQDKYVTNAFCVTNDSEVENVRLTCDYLSCFYNPLFVNGTIDSSKDPYQNLAVGLIVRTSEDDITNVVSVPIYGENPDGDGSPVITGYRDQAYSCHDYYQVYQSEYDVLTNSIQLSPISGPNSKICLEAIEDGHFSYSSNAAGAYFRVLDDSFN